MVTHVIRLRDKNLLFYLVQSPLQHDKTKKEVEKTVEMQENLAYEAPPSRIKMRHIVQF